MTPLLQEKRDNTEKSRQLFARNPFVKEDCGQRQKRKIDRN